MEDDRDDARLTQRRLERKGFRIDIATDGERGLAMLESGIYDAALVKYRLAGIDGLQVLKTLAETRPGFPTVLVIGVDDESAAFEALKLDAVDCMVKDAAGEYLDRLPIVIELLIEKRRLAVEKNRAEEALRDSQARLSRAQGIACLGYWEWSADDDHQYWSEETFCILGLDPALCLSSHAAFVARLHDDDRENVLEWIADIISGTGTPGIEFRVHRPDGIVRWVRALGEAVGGDNGRKSRLEATLQDITEHRMALDEARHEHRLLRNAIESLSDGFSLYDADDRLVICNENLRKTFPGMADVLRPGMPFETVVRTFVERSLAPIGYADPEDWISSRLESHRHPGQAVDFQRPNGRWVQINEYRTTDGGTALVRTDITERKKVEEELRHAREAAAAADTAKSEFLARMSHDMRVPLNSILGFSEIIGTEVLGFVENRKYVEYGLDIHASGKRLLNLLDDIVDLAKIEAGKFEIADDAVDVATLVASTARLIDPQARAAGLVMEVDVMPALPPVRGDRGALARILENLVSNAARFTPGGGTIRLAAAVDAAGSMIIQITDTGIGIAEADIPKALTPFGQIKSAKINGNPGAGLGLPIVRHLVELHDGILELESTPGAGTTVTVRLPAGRVLRRS